MKGFVDMVPIYPDDVLIGPQKALFQFLYQYKVKWYQRGYETPLIDKLVFKKVAKLMGGRVRIMMSGGAPLSPDTS
ncbi:Long-chain-fatty-acid--CoA ligase 4 [Eumeta japonica]|uniref:Long-chain-fatty-acid--CoA ligase 4 n=1 Tax=Eumeta variegata TaxID=151549 RepID=A0A4C1SDT2_EUMVA|nr:Long-chain-fatty-acid--CoA ligase 4 [Eumeta japonica]